MARPKTFDPDQALDKAMQIFWRKGYEATSIRDLVAATGLNRSSLYATFGCKRELYLRALDRYRSSYMRAALALLSREESPKRGIEQLMRTGPGGPGARNQRRGCFLCNAAIELGGRDAGIAAVVGEAFADIEDAIAGALDRAKAKGEIRCTEDARSLAHLMTDVLMGARVLTKARRADAAQAAIDAAMGALA